VSEPAPTGADQYLVSVRATRPLTADEASEFGRLGGMGGDRGETVLSARLSRDGVAALSQKPWVHRLTLARRLHPV
jgi:hypothetical protein